MKMLDFQQEIFNLNWNINPFMRIDLETVSNLLYVTNSHNTSIYRISKPWP